MPGARSDALEATHPFLFFFFIFLSGCLRSIHGPWRAAIYGQCVASGSSGDQGQGLTHVLSPFGRPHCTELGTWSALEYGPFIDVASGTGICLFAFCRSLSTGYDVCVTSHALDPLPLSQTVTPFRTPFPPRA